MQPLWQLKDATIVLLAGGLGTRMGRPKVDLVIDGEPILLRARREFAGRRVALSLRAGQLVPEATLFDLVLHDEFPDPTPAQLAHSLISRVEGDGVLLPIDMPGVTTSLLDTLEASFAANPAQRGAMFVCGDQLEPLPLAFRAGLDGPLAQRIAAGDHSIRGLAKLDGVAAVPVADDAGSRSAFANLNRPADLEAMGDRVGWRT